MPSETAYLYCKYERLFWSFKKTFVWSVPKQEDDITDVSLSIAKAIHERLFNENSTLYGLLEGNFTSYTLVAGSKPSGSILKLDADLLYEKMQRLDKGVSIIALLKSTIHAIRDLLENYSIALAIYDVYLVKDIANPPSDYRPGIDICTDNIDIYQQHINSFSYILSKAAATRFQPDPKDSEKNITNALVTKHAIHNNIMLDIINGPTNGGSLDITVTTPLNQQRKIKHILETEWLSSTSNTIFHFGPGQAKEPLLMHLLTRLEYNNQHIMLIFNESDGPLSNMSPSALQEIREYFFDVVKQTFSDRKMHIVFLTRPTGEHTLLTLTPDLTQESNGFSPLLDERGESKGFYLSDPEFFKAIHVNHQQHRRHRSDPPIVQGYEKRSHPYMHTKYTPKTACLYIIRTEAQTSVRSSKNIPLHQLGERATITHTVTMTSQHTTEREQHEEQTMTQPQQYTQTHALQQRQQHGAGWELIPIYGFGFSVYKHHLQADSKRWLDATTSPAYQWKKRHLYTKRHAQEVSRYYTDIVHNENYCTAIAARIFGIAFSESETEYTLIKLPNYSIDYIPNIIGENLLENFSYHTDGLNPKYRETALNLLQQRALTRYRYLEYMFKDEPSAVIDPLSPLFSLTPDKGYVFLGCYDLLKADANNTDTEVIAKKLLRILLEDHVDTDIKSVLIAWIIAVCSTASAQHISILTAFLNLFKEECADYYKSILYLFLDGGEKKLQDFLDLLSFFNERNLLWHFYVIYFKHQKYITFLSQCLLSNPWEPNLSLWERNLRHSLFFGEDDPNNYKHIYVRDRHHAFINLAIRTPVKTEPEEWPLMIRFAYHIMLYWAAHHKVDHLFDFYRLEEFWKTLSQKIFFYTQQEDETNALLESLVDGLITKKGLSIQPTFVLTTFFSGLKYIIDHAIEHHTLKEQIAEINGLSFIWLDAPYAIEHGLTVVCKEANIVSSAINPHTKSYTVSHCELQKILDEYTDETFYPEASVFRYLCGETQRHPLRYYRELQRNFLEINNTIASEYSYAEEMIFIYIVLQTTCQDYYKAPNTQTLRDNFLRFHRTHPYLKNIPASTMHTYLDNFFSYYEPINHDLADDRHTLRQYLTHIPALSTISPILNHPFHIKNLVAFITQHKDDILSNTLTNVNNTLAHRLLLALVEKTLLPTGNNTQKEAVFSVIKKLYPDLLMKYFIPEATAILECIKQYIYLLSENDGETIHTTFLRILETHQNAKAGPALITLLSQAMRENHSILKTERCVAFMTMMVEADLIDKIENKAPLLMPLLTYYLDNPMPMNRMRYLLNMSHNLFDTNIAITSATHTLSSLLRIINSHEGAFLLEPRIALHYTDVINITALIDDCSVPLAYVRLVYQENSRYNFESLLIQLSPIPAETRRLLINVLLSLNTHQYLETLLELSPELLRTVARLRENTIITAEQLAQILNDKENISENIKRIETALLKSNAEKRVYNPKKILEKISEVQPLLEKQVDTQPLEEIHKQLNKDYEQVIGYVSKSPVYKRADGEEVSAAQLSEEEFPLVFKALKAKITSKTIQTKTQEQYVLMLLAVACVAIEKHTLKFPRESQILCVLNTIRSTFYQQQSIINKIPTGEGKSMISALVAVIICAHKKTANFVTENQGLIEQHRETFFEYYKKYFDISVDQTHIIDKHSTYKDYHESGINFSHPDGWIFFNIKITLEGKNPSPDAYLIADEIDGMLSSTLLFRLSSIIDTLFSNEKTWQKIWQYLLDFTHDEELFISNLCSREEDITNFHLYVQKQTTDKQVAAVLKGVPLDIWEIFIESALSARGLFETREKVDYLIMPSAHDSDLLNAAPILIHNNRPNSSVSYADGIEQMLNTLLSQRYAKKFEVLPLSFTLLITDINKLFDLYRKRVIGLTATPGSETELHEYSERHGFEIFKYPRHYPDNADYTGIIAIMLRTELPRTIFETIESRRNNNAFEPIVVILQTAEDVESCYHFFTGNSSNEYPIQKYDGSTHVNYNEAEIIINAGKSGTVSFFTRCMARGADFPSNIHVINACDDITVDENQQIKGRAARNGEKGSYGNVLILENIPNTIIDNADNLEEVLRIHQTNIGLTRQKERLKNSFLQNVRTYFQDAHFLNLRKAVDMVLIRQYGTSTRLISDKEFFMALYRFNRQIEFNYQQLLGPQETLDQTTQKAFIDTQIAYYNTEVLEKWIPQSQWSNLTIIEPLVPLEVLPSLTAMNEMSVEELMVFSDLGYLCWQMIGQNGVAEVFPHIDTFFAHFDGYFRSECSLNSAVINTTIAYYPAFPEKAITCLREAEKTLLEFTDECNDILPKERMKTFVTEYITTTTTQIEQHEWDAITLPSLTTGPVMEWINYIMSGFDTLNNVMGIVTFATTAHISLLFDYIIYPLLKKGLTKLFMLIAEDTAPLIAALVELPSQIKALTEFLLTLDFEADKNTKTVGDVLDKLAPLLTQPLFDNIYKKLLEKIETVDVELCSNILNYGLQRLEEHRGKTLGEFLNADVLLQVIQEITQAPPIKTFLSTATPYTDLIYEKAPLHSVALHYALALDPADRIKLAKLVTHPEYHQFLSSLPKDTTFAQQAKWSLTTDEAEIPLEIKDAWKALYAYQTNHDRIANDQKHNLITMKKTFHASQENVFEHLNSLKQTRPTAPIKPHAFKITPFHWKCLEITLVIGITATINLMLMSLPMLIGSVITLAYVYRHQIQAAAIHTYQSISFFSNAKDKTAENDDLFFRAEPVTLS